MKKVLLVGKINALLQETHSQLIDLFNVQTSIDSDELIRGFMRLSRPDAVIMCITGLGGEGKKIINTLQYEYPTVPVVCTGSGDEMEAYRDHLTSRQFTVVEDASDRTMIRNILCGILHISEEDIKTNQIDSEEDRQCILLVDDNAFQLRTVKSMLEADYDVLMATSAMKAMTQIGRRIPNLIILDYDMPVCDGKMTFEMIRELDEAKNIPVLFLTGVKDIEHIKAVLSLKPAGYLLKPASQEEITERVVQILGPVREEYMEQ